MAVAMHYGHGDFGNQRFPNHHQHTQRRGGPRNTYSANNRRAPLPCNLAPPRDHHLDDDLYGGAGSDGSDYDLDAFGPVDVDPTLTESEWLRSQGIDPDSLDNESAPKAAAAVLTLEEVSYNRDLQSVNKAERERYPKAANTLWGAHSAAPEDKKVRRRASLNGHRDSGEHRVHYIDQDVRSGSGSGGRGSSRGRSRRGRGRGSPSGAYNGRSGAPPSPVTLLRPGQAFVPPTYVQTVYSPHAQQQQQPQQLHYIAPVVAAVQPHYVALPQQTYLQQQQHVVAPVVDTYEQPQVQQQPQQQQQQVQRSEFSASASSFVPTEVSTEGLNVYAPAFVPGAGFKT